MVYKMMKINLAMSPCTGAALEDKLQLGQQHFAPVMGKEIFFFFLYNYS